MAELVEYSLVVMVSTLFITGSVATYVSLSSFESGIQLRETFASVSGLALQAMENGSARAALTSPQSAIRCANGFLSVSMGDSTEGQSLPIGCDFGFQLSGGTHLLRFSEQASQLDLSVN